MLRPSLLRTLLAGALGASACTIDQPPELEETQDSLRCTPVALVPTEAAEHTSTPRVIARAGASFCKDVEDLAAVVAHVEAMEQLLEEGSDESR